MTRKRKSKSYFAGSVQEAYHKQGTFAIGDRVKIMPWKQGDPSVSGTIRSLTHGNFGNGRIYADISTDDGRSTKLPLGRLRKL